MAEVSCRQRWRWLFLPLSVVALLWAGYLLSDAMPTLMDSLAQLNVKCCFSFPCSACLPSRF